MTATVDRPPPPPPPPPQGQARPGWDRQARLWLTSTAVIAASAVVVGGLEARLPLGPGNTAVHHGYPFFAVGMAAVLAVVGRRNHRHSSRWSAMLRWLATAYAGNALLIALLSYAVTPQGHALPVAALGWVADVVFPVCDVGLLGLIVGTLPDARPGRGHRLALELLALLTGLTILAEAFLPHTLDSTTVQNPLAIKAAAGWSGALQLLIPLMFVYALVISLARSAQLARQSRRHGFRVAGTALGASLALLATFVGQAAVPESNPWAASTITLLGCVTAVTLAARVARAFSPIRASDISSSGVCPSGMPRQR